MKSIVIDTLTDYAKRAMFVYELMRCYIYEDLRRDGMYLLTAPSGENGWEETSEQIHIWEEISHYIEDIDFVLRDELNESVLMASRENQEQFYLGKVENFLRTIHELDDATLGVEFDAFEKKFSEGEEGEKEGDEQKLKVLADEQILDIVSTVLLLLDKIDDVRTEICTHYRYSSTVTKYANQLPILKGLVAYYDEYNKIGYDNLYEVSDNLAPMEPGVKLQWNGTNDSLYDLFAQLSLTNVSATKPLLENTIEGLAKFLAAYVEGMPSVETIERRIRAFREPTASPPVRGRIELHINKEKP